MGMHIELLGRVSIDPPLNPAETEYLRALAYAGPAREGDDPYAVPAHPKLEVLLRRRRGDRPLRNLTDREPPMGCGWSPCGRGCCLSWSGVEKFYYPADWLTFLVTHLLGPGAAAAASGSPDLDGFTFDHHLDGVVAVSCAETEELWLVVAHDNEISEVLLSRGEVQPGFGAWLPDACVLDPLDGASFAGGSVPRRVEGVRYTVQAAGS